jgi:hypothetical protein
MIPMESNASRVNIHLKLEMRDLDRNFSHKRSLYDNGRLREERGG